MSAGSGNYARAGGNMRPWQTTLYAGGLRRFISLFFSTFHIRNLATGLFLTTSLNAQTTTVNGLTARGPITITSYSDRALFGGLDVSYLQDTDLGTEAWNIGTKGVALAGEVNEAYYGSQYIIAALDTSSAQAGYADGPGIDFILTGHFNTALPARGMNWGDSMDLTFQLSDGSWTSPRTLDLFTGFVFPSTPEYSVPNTYASVESGASGSFPTSAPYQLGYQAIDFADVETGGLGIVGFRIDNFVSHQTAGNGITRANGPDIGYMGLTTNALVVVPEPSAVTLVSLGALFLLRRGRRLPRAPLSDRPPAMGEGPP